MMGAATVVPSVGEKVWIAFEGGDVNFPLYLRGDMLSVDSLTNQALIDNTPLDLRTPAAPTGFTVTSVAYFDSSGNLQGRLTFTWDTVTAANDGTAMTIGGYEVWGIPINGADGTLLSGSWSQITRSDTLEALWGPFDVGSVWAFKVRARAVNSPTLGDYCTQVAHTVSSMVAAPGIPSAPVMTSALGNVYAAWNGTNSAGQPMPPSVAFVEVAMGTTATPTAIFGTLTSTGTVPGAFGKDGSGNYPTVYARIRSVDTQGTRSGWGTAASITVVPVLSDPSIQTGLTNPLNSLTSQVSTIQGAVQIVQGSNPSVTITNGAASPTSVQIIPSELDFNYQGVRVAYINSAVSGGQMVINSTQIGHHLISNYDANTTVVRWIA